MKKNWTGERLETFILTRDSIEHLHRYALALEFVKNKTVLDIACGEGYGSHILSRDAAMVFGVDIDQDTVANAKAKYQKPNLSFKHGSASKIPLEDQSVDVVVSFETIEHHDKHSEMMSEIRRVLKKDGLLIISTPDKLYYSDQRNFRNEFHVKELYKEEFRELISANFSHTQLLTQRYTGSVSLIQHDAATTVNCYSGNYSGVGGFNVNPLYLIAIASDAAFEVPPVSLFDGLQITEEAISTRFRNSAAFRTGNLILQPFKILKKLLK